MPLAAALPPLRLRAPSRGASDYARVERAITYIQAHVREQPSLAEIAASAGLSEFHFQRLFQRWAGVSPKRFLQFLTLQEAKRLLAETRSSLLDTSLELGLSGPSRLHDLFLSLEHLTPGEFKGGAAGLTVRWGLADTPLGPALFGALDRGLCALSFASDGAPDVPLAELRHRWHGAHIVHDSAAIRPYARDLHDRLAGQPTRPLSLVLKGTPLQLRVWEALLRIPSGRVAAYSDLARLVGLPRAPRAIGAAVGQNPLAALIPCHRVIHATGAFGQYHWGPARKLALLGLERAAALDTTPSRG